MSQENVRAVREIYGGWARGDFTVGIDLFDPEIEFVSDFGPDRVTATGLDGMRRTWREQLRNWDRWRTGEIQELRDLDDRVLVVNSVHGRGRQSGIEVEIPEAAAAFRFHEGKIIWLLATDRLEVALEALGLSE